MRGADAGAAWAAVSTACAALLYLLDFGTNMSALRTYYMYEYQCPHVPLASSLLRDPICSAIRFGHGLHGIPFQFWSCLANLFTAHITYAIVFCLTLDSRPHPLYLAYFLPLIHLYGLLKLLFHTLSCKDVKELTKSQTETSGLFNAISASLETTPQFLIQFYVAMNLGEHVKGSLDPNFRAQKIPTNLIVSLVVSLLSGSYTTSMAVLSLIDKHMSLARRAYVSFLIGCQTLTTVLLKAMCSTTLLEFSKTKISFPLFIYSICGIITTWLFIDLVLQRRQHNGQGKKKYLRVAHSLGLGLMTIFIGPIYVFLKFSKGPRFIIWATLSHKFADLVGFTLVFVLFG